MKTIEILKEFDGIIGTLLGVIITLILSEYLRNKGKLSIYIVEYKGKYYSLRSRGTTRKDKSDEDYHDYSFELILNIYNGSGLPKIMRNMIIEFKEKGTSILKYTPKDTSTKRHGSAFIIIDEIAIYNIDSKEIQQLHLEGYINEEKLDEIKDVDQIDFTFIDEKNNKKRITIHSGKIDN